MSEPAPLLLDFNGVCRALSIARRTGNRLLAAGRLPAADLNITGGSKGRRWRRDRIEKFVALGAPGAEAFASYLARNLTKGGVA